jgi:glutamate-1-semialdehyde 2,1-aminomutase
VGAFGGKANIMEHIAPSGPVYQAGTLSGNPLAMAAGLAMLNAIEAEGFHDRLETQTNRLVAGLADAAARHNVPLATNQVCGMFSMFFTSTGSVERFDDVAACDVDRFNRFFHAMLSRGVYLAPSAFEAGFLSDAHGDAELEATLTAADQSFAEIAQ